MTFLGLTFIARFINEKANKKLDPAKKAELVDLFSKDRIYYFGTSIVLLGGFLLVLRFNILDAFLSVVIYFTLIIIFFLVLVYLSNLKLNKHDFPKDYIRAYLVSVTLRLLGLAIFIYIFMMHVI